jgi:hypothetical protein
MAHIISIRELLAHMEHGQPFSIEVVSYDRQKGTGGKIHIYEEAVLLTEATRGTYLGRELTESERSVSASVADQELIVPKNPNHYFNYTRNIRILQDGHPTNIIKKVHPPLILKFNGKTVTP